MKLFESRFLIAVGLAGAAGLFLNVNCGGSSGGGTGGTTGTGGTGTGGHTGGTTGTGGTATGGHTGGTTGTGGTAGSSATGGTAGGSATGGTAGGAGATATGGAGGAATGGSGGAGGAATGGTAGGAGGVGGAIVGTALATFDPADGGANLQGFAINIYNTGAGSLDVASDASPAATLGWDGTHGDPTPGSLVVDAPFHAYKEFVDVQKSYGTAALQSWTGKTKLHVRVKINSGFNPSASYPPGIQPYAQSYSAAVDGGAAAAYHGCYAYVNAVAGFGWNEYVLDFSACASPFDLSKIVAFGVELQTGDGATGDAGQPAAPTAAVVNIDSFSVE